METIRFMRLMLMFDLPMETSREKKEYRQFVKFLKGEGFIRIQYSIYCKLCINKDIAKSVSRRISLAAPNKGDIRYLVITEAQYQNIANLNNKYSLQESITTTDRTLMIGGFGDEA